MGERVSRKAICFIRPEIWSVIRRVRILGAVPKFLPAAQKNTTTSPSIFPFYPLPLLPKTHSTHDICQMDAPPIYPDPALTVPRGSFLMSKVGGTFPWKLSEVGRPEFVNLSLPSFDLWIPMAMGGGLRSSYNNTSSMKDE